MSHRPNREPQLPKRPGTDQPDPDLPLAIIRRPASSPMQSAPRRRHWVLEFQSGRAPRLEPLMGWTSGEDPVRGIRLVFPDAESAIRFAEAKEWRYLVLADRPGRSSGAGHAPRPWPGVGRAGRAAVSSRRPGGTEGAGSGPAGPQS